MHVHVLEYPDIFYPFFIVNGVTGVREMHQSAFPLDSLLAWRREITTDMRAGPRIAGPRGFLESEPTDLAPLAIVVTTPARRGGPSIRKAAGAYFVKVRGGLPREIFFAIAAEARRIGIPLAGHLSDSVTVAEASDSGQRSIEHFNYPELEQSCAADVDTAGRGFSINDVPFATFGGASPLRRGRCTPDLRRSRRRKHRYHVSRPDLNILAEMQHGL
jgi:hypothetical protein